MKTDASPSLLLHVNRNKAKTHSWWLRWLCLALPVCVLPRHLKGPNNRRCWMSWLDAKAPCHRQPVTWVMSSVRRWRLTDVFHCRRTSLRADGHMLTTDPCTQMAAYLTNPWRGRRWDDWRATPTNFSAQGRDLARYRDGVVCVLWLGLRHEGERTPPGHAACTPSSPRDIFFFLYPWDFCVWTFSINSIWCCQTVLEFRYVSVWLKRVWNGNFRGSSKQDESCVWVSEV